MKVLDARPFGELDVDEQNALVLAYVRVCEWNAALTTPTAAEIPISPWGRS